MEDLVEGQSRKGITPRGFVVRFWEKVDKQGEIPERCPQLGRCWEWKGEISSAGRPTISICNMPWLAYRISFLIHNGFLNDKLFVMHLCDNPICVNPDHLILGTAKQNTQYALDANRVLKGEKNGQHKLTEIQVLEIRERHNKGDRITAIAKDFPNVWLPCISKIINRERWKHV